MKIVSKFHVRIFDTFREISRQRASRSGEFIVLNDLAGPKEPIQIYFDFYYIF